MEKIKKKEITLVQHRHIAFSFKSLDSSFSNQLFLFKDLVPNKDWIL